MARYASPTDLKARFNPAEIADLASDTGRPIVDIDNNANVLAALDDASGEIEATVLVSSMYTTAQLDALTGNSLAKLKRITCELAMTYLLGRQSQGEDRLKRYQVALEISNDWLDRLRKGENVFNIAANINAGVPSVDGPTVVELDNLNMITSRVRGYWPGAGQRLPVGRG